MPFVFDLSVLPFFYEEVAGDVCGLRAQVAGRKHWNELPTHVLLCFVHISFVQEGSDGELLDLLEDVESLLILLVLLPSGHGVVQVVYFHDYHHLLSHLLLMAELLFFSHSLRNLLFILIETVVLGHQPSVVLLPLLQFLLLLLL